jgi:hypothetical protein
MIRFFKWWWRNWELGDTLLIVLFALSLTAWLVS